MSRRELMIRGVWTLVISLVCFPAALVFSSGRFGNGLNVVVVIVAAIFGTIFLLPWIPGWLMVEPFRGPAQSQAASPLQLPNWLGCSSWSQLSGASWPKGVIPISTVPASQHTAKATSLAPAGLGPSLSAGVSCHEPYYRQALTILTRTSCRERIDRVQVTHVSALQSAGDRSCRVRVRFFAFRSYSKKRSQLSDLAALALDTERCGLGLRWLAREAQQAAFPQDAQKVRPARPQPMKAPEA